MGQIYKIFYSDKAIHLYGKDNHINLDDNFIKYQVDNVSDIVKLKKEFFSSGSQKTTILKSNCSSKELFDMFRLAFKCIEAAGGLVINESGDYLMIFRRGKWDLPKGKLDYDETLEEAAIREVWEETGIKPGSVRSLIGNTYHLYSLKGEVVLKISTWYLMAVNGSPKGIPQEDEDISEVWWFTKDQLKEPLKNCHSSIKFLLDNFLGPL